MRAKQTRYASRRRKIRRRTITRYLRDRIGFKNNSQRARMVSSGFKYEAATLCSEDIMDFQSVIKNPLNAKENKRNPYPKEKLTAFPITMRRK